MHQHGENRKIAVVVRIHNVRDIRATKEAGEQ